MVGGNVGPPPPTNGLIINGFGQVLIGTESDGLASSLSVVTGNTVAVHVRTNSVNGIPLLAENPGGVAGFFSGTIKLSTLGGAGATPLCLNSNQLISNCSSSLRYKKDLQPFSDGLGFINQLRPIAYKWKADNMPDIGFGAEDVAKINPLFVSYNERGEVEGVKYDRLSVVFVNAFKQQQVQLEQQQTLLEQQRLQIEELKKLICLEHSSAQLCRENKLPEGK